MVNIPHSCPPTYLRTNIHLTPTLEFIRAPSSQNLSGLLTLVHTLNNTYPGGDRIESYRACLTNYITDQPCDCLYFNTEEQQKNTIKHSCNARRYSADVGHTHHIITSTYQTSTTYDTQQEQVASCKGNPYRKKKKRAGAKPNSAAR